MSSKTNLKKFTVTALFCAIAFLMTFLFRFKVSFLTFDFKDAIISVVSLLYGPIYGVVSSAVVAVLEFLSVSDTGVYGLIMNFISSATFALGCGLVYKFKRSFGGAIAAVSTSVVCVTAVMMVANIFITPYYMGVPTKNIIGLIPILLLPFNLCKAIINAASVLIIYKPITTSLKKSGLVDTANPVKYTINKKSVLLIVISVIVLIIAILFIILKMDGSFSLFKN
ncbi:MAG: ECF transporter S component [Clostridia bacterium]|nr:ECF transporter S component [Clostridia bacterium]